MRRQPFLLLFLLLATSLPMAAQQCELDDTLAECWERFIPTPAVAEVSTEANVAAANTGITNVLSPSDSALKDFLTLFTASVESATLEDTGQALTLDWNPKLNILGASTALKLQAVFGNTTLSQQAKDVLAANTTAITELDDSLNYDDNIAFSLSFNPMTQTFGRSIRPHSAYFQNLFLSVLPSQAQTNEVLLASPLQTEQKFSSLPADEQAVEMAKIEAAGRTVAAARLGITSFTDAFTALLNNQSQIYVSAVRNMRRNIVGPNQWAIQASYEWGPRNLRSFKKSHEDCGEEQVKTAATAKTCAATMIDYAKDAATDRLAFSLSYNLTNRRWIDLAQYSVAYGIPRSKTLVYSIKYGRPLAPPANATGARIDLDVDYEDSQDQDEDKNRLVGSLTYTYKVSDTVSIPLGIVYASHEADLPASDEQLNAHFGVLFKMPNLPFGGSSN